MRYRAAVHELNRTRRRRALRVAALLSFAVGLAACGSSGPGSTAASRSAGSSTGTTTTVSSAVSSAESAAHGAQASSQAAAAATGTATFPAVSGAGDLKKEPTISAGSQPPPTTLQTRDLVVGTGATATATSTVTIHYVGADYTDGKDFDASWTDPGGPTATFSLTNTVQGFAQGIAGMKVGGRREIVIPPALGYGANAQGPISANETLVFVVDLLAVR